MAPQVERRRPKPRARNTAPAPSNSTTTAALPPTSGGAKENALSKTSKGKEKATALGESEAEDDFFTFTRRKVKVARKESSTPEKRRGEVNSESEIQGQSSLERLEKGKGKEKRNGNGRNQKRRRIDDLIKATKEDIVTLDITSDEDEGEEGKKTFETTDLNRELSLTPPPDVSLNITRFPTHRNIFPISRTIDLSSDNDEEQGNIQLNPRLRDIQQRVTQNRQNSKSVEPKSPVRGKSPSRSESGEEGRHDGAEESEEDEQVEIEVHMKMIQGREGANQRLVTMYERPMKVNIGRSETFERVFAEVAIEKGVDKIDLILTDMDDRKIFSFSTPAHSNIFGKVKFKGYKVSDFERRKLGYVSQSQQSQSRVSGHGDNTVALQNCRGGVEDPISLDSSEGEFKERYSSAIPVASMSRNCSASPSTSAVPMIKLTLRGTRGKSGSHSVIVKRTMTARQLIRHYLKMEKLPLDLLDRCGLSFEGEKFGMEDEIGDCDVEDEDLVDVEMPSANS